ncbi:MAG TPA: amidase [Myxococcaceae bacterium]|nr:amidase [Myxococcaceae bacterium]
MSRRPIEELGAAAAIALLQRGALTSERLVRACLDRIARDEPRIRAWAWLDPEQALAAARAVDAAPGRPPLYGLPVGIKDIIDTSDAPTECGTPLHRGRRPAKDAACVAALRAAGAVILGKTVTTELAFFAPGPTRNPRNPAHTPGGSSSGSAAGVADCMVPAALGTQTAGSIIRPAAYCGVVGFKPSHGLLSLEGVLRFAPSLDTLGVLVREVADVAPLLTALGAPVEVQGLPRPPRIGLWRSAQWARATAAMQHRLEEVAAMLSRAGATVLEVDPLPDEALLAEDQALIMAAEAVSSFGALRASGGLSPQLTGLLDRGAAARPEEVRAAKVRAGQAGAAAATLLADLDVLLTPSAPGEAPEGLASTGDPVFNRVVTMLGLPAISLPAGTGPSGLPLGVQLVGAPRAEAALLAVASWVETRMG